MYQYPLYHGVDFMADTLNLQTDVVRQHTVPRFLLTHFSAPGKGKIFNHWRPDEVRCVPGADIVHLCLDDQIYCATTRENKLFETRPQVRRRIYSEIPDG